MLMLAPGTVQAQSAHPTGARGGILVPGARTLPRGTLSLGSYATFTRFGTTNQALGLGWIAYGLSDNLQLYGSRSSFFTGSGDTYFDYAGFVRGHAFGPIGLTFRLPAPPARPFQLAVQAAVTPGIHQRALSGHNHPYARDSFDVRFGLAQSLRLGNIELRAGEGMVITEDTPVNVPNHAELGAGLTWSVTDWLGLEAEVLSRLETETPINIMQDYLAVSGGALVQVNGWLGLRGGYFLGLSDERTDGIGTRAESWGAYGSIEVQLWRPDSGRERPAPRPRPAPPTSEPVPAEPEVVAVEPTADSDGDGVTDDIDQEPGTPAGAVVDAQGRSVDSDGDGIPDGLDLEINTPEGAMVDTQGRALDGDGDGIPDGLDLQPDTPAGVPVDAQGRGLYGLEADLITKGLLNLNTIYFEYNSATLQPESYQTLHEVGLILAKYRALKIEIGGHSDSIGSDVYNQELSRTRAQSVLNWLLANIPELGLDRFTVYGYGESQPVADNDTEEGRILNRRVAFKVLNPEELEKYRPPGH